jgi:hypothetical protein
VRWQDEPDTPEVALWRPVISGVRILDKDGGVVMEQGVFDRTTDVVSRPSSPNQGTSDDGGGASSASPFAGVAATVAAAAINGGGPHGAAAAHETESSGRRALSSLLAPAQAPFEVQLHPGTQRHKFQFLKCVSLSLSLSLSMLLSAMDCVYACGIRDATLITPFVAIAVFAGRELFDA